MVKNTPEYLVQEVFDQYGIEVPLETVITLLESDPYLTPESLYLYVSDLKEDSKENYYCPLNRKVVSPTP